MFNDDEPNIISSNISSIPKNNDIISFSCIDILKTVNSFSLLDTSNIFDISCMFYGCFSLISLPDISNWNTLNFRRINRIFYNCRSLKSLPNISKWDISNISNMEEIFSGCQKINIITGYIKLEYP